MKKEKWVSTVCFILFTACLSFSVLGLSYRQMVLTITIPDENTSGTYQSEIIVPEGAVAVNFTVWGAEGPWGIKTENTGASGESLFVYYPELESPDEFIDTESSESADIGVGDTSEYGYDYDSELSRLTLPSGTYSVWVSGSPGTMITIQYLLEER